MAPRKRRIGAARKELQFPVHSTPSMRYVATMLLRFLSNSCKTVGTDRTFIIPLSLVHFQDKRTPTEAQHNSEKPGKLSTESRLLC